MKLVLQLYREKTRLKTRDELERAMVSNYSKTIVPTFTVSLHLVQQNTKTYMEKSRLLIMSAKKEERPPRIIALLMTGQLN